MQTKYYLTFEQVGIIRRIPLKEQDPDMQGILDAFISKPSELPMNWTMMIPLIR